MTNTFAKKIQNKIWIGIPGQKIGWYEDVHSSYSVLWLNNFNKNLSSAGYRSSWKSESNLYLEAEMVQVAKTLFITF